MANTLTFTPSGSGGAPLTVTPIPGTVQTGDGNEDRGGGNYATSRAAKAANGSCEAELDSSALTLALITGLYSDSCKDSAGACAVVGEADVDITGAGDFTAVTSHDALLDFELSGDGAMRVRISWKGHPVT